MAGREIDAGAELDRIEGERGRSELGNERRGMAPGGKAFLIVAAVLIVALLSFLVVRAMEVKAGAGDEVKPAPQQKIGRAVPELKVVEPKPEPVAQPVQPIEPVAQPVAVPPSPAGAASTEPEGPTQAELVRQRRLQGQLNGNQGSQNNQGAAQAQPVDNGTGAQGDLADKMQPLRLSPAYAGTLHNRDMLLTQGSMLDCQLETKIITDQPGMTSCFLTRDIYSTNRRVVLLDRGSKVVGQYQSGIQQGQNRIFVLWTRVETPQGVIINLDSPGTGPLGEAGVGGWVDTHFWKRFGAAIMLSLIDDVGDFLSNKASEGEEDRITFENTSENSQEMASTALEHTIDIPPTLYKNQGERLSIFVARDLDFSGVYGLERR